MVESEGWFHLAAVYLGLGSNLGDRQANLCAALNALLELPQIRLKADHAVASLYETSPVGVDDKHTAYLNTVVGIETSLEPNELIQVCLDIETKIGRQRNGTCQPRTIDIDLLLYDALILDSPLLTVPHPRLHERLFALEPLAEIAGDVIHPILQISIIHLCDRCASDHPGQEIKRVKSSAWACYSANVDD